MKCCVRPQRAPAKVEEGEFGLTTDGASPAAEIYAALQIITEVSSTMRKKEKGMDMVGNCHCQC